MRLEVGLRNVQRFRGGLVFKAHRLCVSLNSRRESNKEEVVSLNSRRESNKEEEEEEGSWARGGDDDIAETGEVGVMSPFWLGLRLVPCLHSCSSLLLSSLELSDTKVYEP